MTREPTLHVRFYRTETGAEPVRNWVLELTDVIAERSASP